jgi:hypothetical protein
MCGKILRTISGRMPRTSKCSKLGVPHAVGYRHWKTVQTVRYRRLAALHAGGTARSRYRAPSGTALYIVLKIPQNLQLLDWDGSVNHSRGLSPAQPCPLPAPSRAMTLPTWRGIRPRPVKPTTLAIHILLQGFTSPHHTIRNAYTGNPRLLNDIIDDVHPYVLMDAKKLGMLHMGSCSP